MQTSQCKILGQPFALPVHYDCYPGETPLPEQTEALHRLNEAMQAEASAVLAALKAYKQEQADEEWARGQRYVFAFVRPKSIYLMREPGQRSVAILCDSRFDPEHGVALVFKNEKFERVCAQDYVL